MSITKRVDFEGVNELQKSADEITPVYLDALGDKEAHSRIVELAQEHSHEPNLLKDTK